MYLYAHHDACYGEWVRTTVSLDPDIEAEVDRLRRDRGLGLSEAVNSLARRGLAARQAQAPYTARSFDLGIRLDISNIGEVLDLMDDA